MCAKRDLACPNCPLRERCAYATGDPGSRRDSRSEPDRSYHAQDSGLGDAEEQLLCLPFVVTLDKTLDDRLPLDTFVLDEPFDHLDDTATEELPLFVTEDYDRRYIFTTSDNTVVRGFPEDQRREVDRDSKQVELGESPGDN